MNKERLELWLQNLESGAYQQGVGYLLDLRDGAEKYCCLGVLSDLAAKNGLDMIIARREGECAYFDGNDEFPPDKVVHWLEWVWDDFIIPARLLDKETIEEIAKRSKWRGEIPYNFYLADINDQGFSFHEIAAIIRQAISNYEKEEDINIPDDFPGSR